MAKECEHQRYTLENDEGLSAYAFQMEMCDDDDDCCSHHDSGLSCDAVSEPDATDSVLSQSSSLASSPFCGTPCAESAVAACRLVCRPSSRAQEDSTMRPDFYGSFDKRLL